MVCLRKQWQCFADTLGREMHANYRASFGKLSSTQLARCYFRTHCQKSFSALPPRCTVAGVPASSPEDAWESFIVERIQAVTEKYL